jgi:excisionase family DNA binding protein
MVLARDLLSSQQVAERLGISTTMVRRLLARGDLPCLETAAGRLVPRSYVEDELARRAGTPIPATE